MKLLILGYQGNLGGQLLQVFAQNSEYEIFKLDRADVDITNSQALLEKINTIKPDIIINATAYNAVDKCEEDQAEYSLAKKINGEAVATLAHAALANNAILVHYSTDYVFAGDNSAGYQESDVPAPINNYGQTKLLGEQAILNLAKDGLKYYLIRTSKLFGPRGAAELSKPSFFDIMMNLAQTKSEIDVVDEEISAFTYTPDLALRTKEILEDGRAYGIYHVTNFGYDTWYRAAKELFNILGADIKVNPIPGDKMPRPALRPKYSELMNTKLPALRDYREALKEYLDIKK